MITILLQGSQGPRYRAVRDPSIQMLFYGKQKGREETFIWECSGLDSDPAATVRQALRAYSVHCTYVANEFRIEIVNLRSGEVRDCWDYKNYGELPKFTPEQGVRLPVGIFPNRAWNLEARIGKTTLKVKLTAKTQQKVVLLRDDRHATDAEVIEAALSFLNGLRVDIQNDYLVRYTDHSGEVLPLFQATCIDWKVQEM